MLFVTLAGCGTAKFSSVTGLISQGKNLSSLSSIEPIDSFTLETGPNKFKLQWQIQPDKNSKLVLSRNNEDAIFHGGSLKINYDLAAHGFAKISTSFPTRDVSQAETLIFFIEKKSFNEFKGFLSVTLVDENGTKQAVSIEKKFVYEEPTRNWYEVQIPKQEFKQFDFNQINGVEVQLDAKKTPLKGVLVLDEIALLGKENLMFESARDNIAGFPSGKFAEAEQVKLIEIKDSKEFVRAIAADTWKYFNSLIDVETSLPVDHVRVGRTKGIGNYTGPTNIALDWISTVGAFDLSLIDREQAVSHIKKSFESLKKFEKWEDQFYYNFYNTHTLKVQTPFVSTVDNGWLAGGLIIIRQAFPEEFKADATKILNQMNFSKFYDPSNGQLKIGYDRETDSFSGAHYGLLASEARLTSYIGIGKGDLPKEHWVKIYRTLPKIWEWQKQVPQGEMRTFLGAQVFESYYTYRKTKFMPSWGGSLFEFLAPTLLIDELKYASDGLGKNDQVVTDLNILYALRDKKYPVWGLAPAAIQNGNLWAYREYGVPELGAKGYKDDGVIAPYASLLALATEPDRVVENLRVMLKKYKDIYGEYGFYDTVDVNTNKVNKQYLLLDQAMSFIAMVNYVKDGSLRNRFHADPVGRAGEELLKEKIF